MWGQLPPAVRRAKPGCRTSCTEPCHPERSCRPQSGRQRSRRIPTMQSKCPAESV